MDYYKCIKIYAYIGKIVREEIWNVKGLFHYTKETIGGNFAK